MEDQTTVAMDKVVIDKVVIDGVEYSKEEILAAQVELASLQAVVKAGKKAGLIKATKRLKVSDPRKVLLGGLFASIIDTNKAEVEGLFVDTIDVVKKPFGNVGVNIAIETGNYDIQILSKTAKKAIAEDAKALKAKKAAETETTAEPTAELPVGTTV